MNQSFSVRSRAALLATAIAIAGFDGALAQPTGGIYQAAAITTGSDTRFRAKGLAECLRDVLVKASGEPRLYKDPRVGELMTRADQYAAYISYRDQMEGLHHHDDQGTYDRPFDLTVQFDWHRINSALQELGEKPWIAERPTIVPVISVRGFERPFDQKYLLSDEAPAGLDQRNSLRNIAERYGVHLRIPSTADFNAWGVGTDGFATPMVQPAAQQLHVTGTLDFRLDTFGWVGNWKMRWQGVDHAWRVSGVSFDKAFDNLIAGVVRVASGHSGPE